MFFQISVNRAGVISGAYTSTITGDQRPIAGQVDKATQRVAWRIGDNTETIFETSLANLTQDVSPLAIHFGKAQHPDLAARPHARTRRRRPAAETSRSAENAAPGWERESVA